LGHSNLNSVTQTKPRLLWKSA